MRVILAFVLFVSIKAEAQVIYLGPYPEGEPVNEVVFLGSYESAGNCSSNGGFDFEFDFTDLVLPDGLEFALIIDSPVPSNTTLVGTNGIINVGDYTAFTPTSSGLQISADNQPATINFHVLLTGTPSTAWQEYPCWISSSVTEAACSNTYSLIGHEGLTPCWISEALSIGETTAEFVNLTPLKDNLVELNSTQKGIVTIIDLTGRVFLSQKIDLGRTTINTQSLSTGVYVFSFQGDSIKFSKKISFLNDAK